MSNRTPNENGQPWWALPGTNPVLPGSSAPTNSSASSVQSRQVSPADTARSTPPADESWSNRILRGRGESVDDYIARLEAECTHHPRPAKKPRQTKEEYADELWLRVYNKYCKRKSRANGNNNGKRQSSTASNRSRAAKKVSTRAASAQPSASSTLNQNSLLLQSFQPSNTGYGNGTSFADPPGPGTTPATQPPMPSLPPPMPHYNVVQSQEAASVRLQGHIRDRMQQNTTLEQYLRSQLDIPSTGHVFDATTSRFHDNFSRIANFAGFVGDGSTLTLHPSALQVQPGGLDIDAQAAAEFGNFENGPISSLAEEEYPSSTFDYKQDIDMDDEE